MDNCLLWSCSLGNTSTMWAGTPHPELHRGCGRWQAGQEHSMVLRTASLTLFPHEIQFTASPAIIPHETQFTASPTILPHETQFTASSTILHHETQFTASPAILLTKLSLHPVPLSSLTKLSLQLVLLFSITKLSLQPVPLSSSQNSVYSQSRYHPSQNSVYSQSRNPPHKTQFTASSTIPPHETQFTANPTIIPHETLFKNWTWILQVSENRLLVSKPLNLSSSDATTAKLTQVPPKTQNWAYSRWKKQEQKKHVQKYLWSYVFLIIFTCWKSRCTKYTQIIQVNRSGLVFPYGFCY